ncbi:MAG: class I SAM-dependent methyltransferase, partial [Thermoplasmata archaeon]|nr:class I SAM-dependent methyltransferase [Thermoplasmata archaeon]
MAKTVRKPLPGSSFELYARAMLDHWMGKKVFVEFERDDGYRNGSKIDSYFAPPSKWPRMEQEGLRFVRGRVLDIGCGPGRHALFLQKKGVDVVGIDASPTQVALARIRGLAQVNPGSDRRLPRGLGTFNTVLMMGNNLGLPGTIPRLRRFLRELRGITRTGARLIGSS